MGDRQDESEAHPMDHQDRAGKAEKLHQQEQADEYRVPAHRRIDEDPGIDPPEIESGAQNLNVCNDIADDKRHSVPQPDGLRGGH